MTSPLQKALEVYERAVAELESIEGVRVAAELLNNIGCLHFQGKNYDKAQVRHPEKRGKHGNCRERGCK